MSSSNSKSASLPKVEPFNVPNKAPVPLPPAETKGDAVVKDVAPVATQPKAQLQKPKIMIGKGGMALAVKGAEDLPVPYQEGSVSTRGAYNKKPLVDPIGESATPLGGKSISTYATATAAGLVLLSAISYIAFDLGKSSSDAKLATVWDSEERTSTHVSTPIQSRGSLVDGFRTDKAKHPLGDLTPRKVKVKPVRISGDAINAVEPVTESPRASLELEDAIGIAIPRPNPRTPTKITQSPKASQSYRASGSFLTELAALRDGTRSEPLTIVHIGDSHIASDAFSEGIREGLQKAFGDAGRGAVMPAGADKYARAGGVSMVSTGWSAANSLRLKSGPYGLSGYRVAASSTSAQMSMSLRRGTFDWAEVTVLTGPNQGKVTLSVGDKTETFNARADKTGSKVVRINEVGTTVQVKPAGSGKTTVLNWATGQERAGIRYVNFGVSGATAYLPKRWNSTLVSNDLKHLNPDLIVWGYGTNEGFNGNLSVKSYKSQMSSIYDTFSEAAPKADWLFLGPASGLSRRGKAAGHCGTYKIPLKLGAVSDTIKEFASANRHHFWDWADAMGGACAIDEWAKASPKLAAGDRVHLTARGYQKSASMLVDHIKALLDEEKVVASASVTQ